MNYAQRLLGLLFVGLASTALFIACGDSADSCLTDADCELGFVCEQELCIQTCNSAADCPAGDDCLPRPGAGAELICVEGAGPTNNVNNPVNNPNNPVNNPNNTNNQPDPTYAVLIRDTTTGAAGCEISDPGSDIATAALEDLEGNILGYANALAYEAGEEPNGNDYPDLLTLLDGSAPSFGLQCPESFSAESVAALGCGGYVVVQFLDGSGVPQIIDSSTQITVVEYGPQCGGSADDSFDIVLCSDTNAAYEGNISSCNDVVGSGSGIVIADNL